MSEYTGTGRLGARDSYPVKSKAFAWGAFKSPDTWVTPSRNTLLLETCFANIFFYSVGYLLAFLIV